MSEELRGEAVVLLSGGLDSSIVLAGAVADGYRVHALTFDYNQRHRVELVSARRVAEALGVASHRVIELADQALGGSALTGDGEVPKGPRAPGADPIPPTYVPARNTVFLALALSWAERQGARDIFVGVSSVDYSGYPDCRPEFIEAFEVLANLGTRAADGGQRYRIHAPLMGLTKGETIRLGRRLGLDLGLTHTCYDPRGNGSPCGECESCALRARGFEEAGVPDPALRPRGS